MVRLELFNPMYHYVTFIRDIMLWHQLPALTTVVGCIACAAISLVVGIVVFRKNERKFILYI